MFSNPKKLIPMLFAIKSSHDPFRNPDPTDSRSISLGVAEAGTLKLDLRALKSQNPIFFS